MSNKVQGISPPERYHFLDGLRAWAMLLGIVLHAAMSFLGFPIWPAVDTKSDPVVFGWILDSIHGFRMPLFFLVSGFFTAMMCQKRGVRALIKHRALRIGVPLLAGTLIVFPVMIALAHWGSEVKSQQEQALQSREKSLERALLEGSEDTVRALLAEGVDANHRDQGGSPLLRVAAVWGHEGIVEALLDYGADPEARGSDGGTALMSAAFFGRTGVVKLLIERRADVNATNHEGSPVIESATVDFSLVKEIGKMFAIPIDQGMEQRRKECAEILREAGAKDRGFFDQFVNGGKALGRQAKQGEADKGQTFENAAWSGDLETIRRLLEQGVDPNRVDKQGTPMLSLAALMGQAPVVELLLDWGAEIQARGADGGTALMAAAFFGRLDVLKLLIARGADVNATNEAGASVIQSATMDFAIVQMVGKMLSIPLDEHMPQRREQAAQILMKAGAQKDWYRDLAFVPIFHHLWFLHYLLWLVAIFILVKLLWTELDWRIPRAFIKTPGCFLWLLPLSFYCQWHMPESFGPATATGLLPWPPKLAYYGLFFFFGVMCYGKGWWEQKAGTRWWAWLLLALPCLWFGREWIREERAFEGVTLTVIYTWATIVGVIGFFRRYFNGGSPTLRYLSDASYWLYLAHLPVMIALQILVSNWEFPALIKCSLICISVTGLLLIFYHYGVRYTWIGAILNGRKHRSLKLLKTRELSDGGE